MGKFTGHTITSDSVTGSAEIERSLKFHDGDSAYLSRTPGSAGNRKTFTFSCWFKRSTLGTQSGAFLKAGAASSNYFKINIANDHKLYVLATIGGGYTEYWRSAQLFRDIAGWTHLVLRWDTTQGTAADRVRVYINGTQMGTSSYSAPSQNLDGFVNDTNQHEIGASTVNSQYWDGYIAEVNFVDGLSLGPSSFGFTGGQTNVWLPRRYTGSYGTNGFRLDFNDNSSTAALGIDKSPNGNDFTANNFSVSSGVGNDSVIDSPNAGHRDSNNDGLYYENSNDFTSVSYSPDGSVYLVNSTQITSLTTWNNDDVLGFALDLDNDKFFISKNGTFFSNGTGTQDPVTGTNPLYSGGVLTSRKDLDGFVPAVQLYNDKVFTADFGQQGFAYTPPTGFKAISSRNFVPSTPAFRNPKRHFEILTYTGNSTNNRAITGLGFSPDFVWIKRRSGGNQSPFWVSRGITISDSGGTGNVGPLAPNQSYAQSATNTDGGFASFDIDGFTLGKGSSTANADAPYQRNNANSATYVAWCWRAGGATTVANTDGSIASAVSVNKEAGFSIVTYTGTNGNGTFGHGLGKAPKWVIIKRLDTASNWGVYHESIGNTKRLVLDLANASASSSGWWNNTSPTSTTVSVGTDAGHNGSTDDYVAYCWTDVPGFSKFGSYVGNGNSNGQYVYLGFRPAFILIKREASENWIIADYKRNSNDRTSPADSYILANGNGAESTGIIYDLVQNGVKFQSSSQNESGSVYYYAAFADSPGITPFGGATANAQ